MPIPSTKAKLFVPTLVMLALFLAACSSTQAPSGPISQAQESPVITMDANGSQVYNQIVRYNNPAGGDDVGFALTVGPDGVITAASSEVMADPSHEISVQMQTNFANEVASQVVGKPLAGLQVDRIGGASLTTGSFQEFLNHLQS